MDLRRSINVKFWTDEWIEKLDQKGKLLFLYLLTNPLTNLLGIYKISIKRISFETGLTEEAIKDCLKSFESVLKCFYIDEYIVLTNHLKNQNLNTNMVKNVMSDFNNIPNSLKDKLKLNHSESFESLSKSLVTLSTLESEIGKLKDENEKQPWKNNFDVYKKELRDEFIRLTKDKNYISKRQEFHPRLDIIKSLEKACADFWVKEAGWKNKKLSKTEIIDWEATFNNALTLKSNQVWIND
jgi:hypothetical protein